MGPCEYKSTVPDSQGKPPEESEKGAYKAGRTPWRDHQASQ